MSTTYVTTPIYYVNAEPHLGHAYTTIIGDALTRWHRLLGDEVKYLTGTDEHGLKIQQAAEAQGTSPQAFVDEIAPKFAAAWEHLGIANDDFIRTTEPRHKAAVTELLQRCYDAGDIELDTFSGKYCVGCEEYYSDDELVTIDGVAPKFASAWADLNIANDDFIRTTEPRHKAAVAELLQRCYDAGDIELDTYSGKYCVGCELYYSDDELVVIDGVADCCPIHKRPVETLHEENYFFRLSRFEDRLLDWYAGHPGAMKPENRANEAIGLIKSGLRDFSISRTSLEWGIPLPWDPEHVAYVWFDALTNYLAAVGFGDPDQDYREYWPVDYHLIGKDIVRQHCVYWPAMLMSAGVELPKGWGIGGWLLVDGEKMAKSGGNVVDPLDLIDTVGVDGFRYYVLAETPYGNDGDFSYDGLVARYNSDLANNLGNLAARVATVVAKKCDGIGPAPRSDSSLASAAAKAVEDTTRAARMPRLLARSLLYLATRPS